MKRSSHQPFQCQEIRPHLDAYLDDEITDSSLIPTIQEHLQKCSGCQSELAALNAVRDQLRGLPTLAASKRLRDNVQALAREPVGARSESSRTLPAQRPMGTVALVAASVLVLSISVVWMWSAQNDGGKGDSETRGDLIAFVDDYVATVQAHNAPAVETPDPDKMESWLAARLDFAPRLPRWPWAELVTGRLCFIHGRRVARVEYKAGEDDLTLFVQPLTEEGIPGDSAMTEMNGVVAQTLRGFKIACWRTAGLDYVLVGPASAAQLFTNIETGG